MIPTQKSILLTVLLASALLIAIVATLVPAQPVTAGPVQPDLPCSAANEGQVYTIPTPFSCGPTDGPPFWTNLLECTEVRPGQWYWWAPDPARTCGEVVSFQ